MKVELFIEDETNHFPSISSFANWNYPVLPRIGELIKNPYRFLDDEGLEKLKVFDKQYDDMTFFHYVFHNIRMNDYPFRIAEIEWCHKDNEVYPRIFMYYNQGN